MIRFRPGQRCTVRFAVHFAANRQTAPLRKITDLARRRHVLYSMPFVVTELLYLSDETEAQSELPVGFRIDTVFRLTYTV